MNGIITIFAPDNKTLENITHIIDSMSGKNPGLMQ